MGICLIYWFNVWFYQKMMWWNWRWSSKVEDAFAKLLHRVVLKTTTLVFSLGLLILILLLLVLSLSLPLSMSHSLFPCSTYWLFLNVLADENVIESKVKREPNQNEQNDVPRFFGIGDFDSPSPGIVSIYYVCLLFLWVCYIWLGWNWHTTFYYEIQ